MVVFEDVNVGVFIVEEHLRSVQRVSEETVISSTVTGAEDGIVSCGVVRGAIDDVWIRVDCVAAHHFIE